ncbi:amidohydrolase 2 [Colletotrichum zoysiae]|uniref:Amidohydrolase 2 n=1 Tax=Colletotrichum zoysiae TaxID=1216348 RepID=A0AAD9HTQ0_9PEZI|nr:amidohydrolase 2 [Colletotrichum zoysiae]
MAPLIAIEEHYISPLLDDAPGGPRSVVEKVFGPAVLEKLVDVGPARLREMAEGSVAMTVLSHLPMDLDPALCAAVNDDLRSKIARHPDRYAAFALLPLRDPAAAAGELRRAVRRLGFVGALVQNHLDDGGFFDAPRFDPLWAAAEELGVPVYLHPAYPPADESRVNFDGGGAYGPAVAAALGAWAWGWHSRTGLHFLRLFAAGVFDRFPRLRLVLGHMGEMLPFMLGRAVRFSADWPSPPRRGLREVWDANVWVTTSGMFSLAPMACLLRETRAERVLFSVDYPFSGNAEGRAFMDELRASGLVSEAEWEGIAWKNAKGLLKLDPGPGDTEQGQVAC